MSARTMVAIDPCYTRMVADLISDAQLKYSTPILHTAVTRFSTSAVWTKTFATSLQHIESQSYLYIPSTIDALRNSGCTQT